MAEDDKIQNTNTEVSNVEVENTEPIDQKIAVNVDQALNEVEETLDEIEQVEGKEDTLELSKLDRQKRIEYVEKLFSHYKKLSNLRESIRVNGEPLGTVMEKLDKIYDAGNLEFASDQYRFVTNKVLDMVSNDYVEKMQWILSIVMQLLDEFESINIKAEQLLKDERKRNESLLNEITKLRAEIDQKRTPEVTSDTETEEEKAPEIDVPEPFSPPAPDDKFDEKFETFKAGVEDFYKRSKNKSRDLKIFIDDGQLDDLQLAYVKKLIKMAKEEEKKAKEATQ